MHFGDLNANFVKNLVLGELALEGCVGRFEEGAKNSKKEQNGPHGLQNRAKSIRRRSKKFEEGAAPPESGLPRGPALPICASYRINPFKLFVAFKNSSSGKITVSLSWLLSYLSASAKRNNRS